MRKHYKLLFILPLLAFFIGCSDDDKLPKPIVAFTTGKNIHEVGVPVTFTNTTTNAATYEWDFGNGLTSDQVSPTTIYDETGVYTVTLIATTTDNQSEELSIDVIVGERELFVIGYNNISFENNAGLDWDEIDPDSASNKLPDVWIIMGPLDPDNFGELFVIGPIIPDLSQNLVATVNLSVNGGADAITTLSNEDWFFTFYDYDGPDLDIDPNATIGDLIDMSELMTDINFHPVEDAEADADGEGTITLTQGAYSVDLEFKIE